MLHGIHLDTPEKITIVDNYGFIEVLLLYRRLLYSFEELISSFLICNEFFLSAGGYFD
jgi:hypothetical protein